MNERITNVEVQEFLQDYKENSETLILEEGKEKNELLESARKRGIIISKNDIDLGVIKTIYCFTSKANANKKRVPKDEFVKIFPQIVGRPMNNCHDRKFILGFYVDYKYILKEEKAIAYAVFFKSAYPKLWEKAKDFQKKKRLSSSYEIWSPKDKRKQLSDGTEELRDMSIAGGALIFEEYGDEPAFKDAKVLTIARKELEQIVDDKCLVYASKHKEEELITSTGEMTSKKVEIEKPTNTKVVIPSPTIRKIKCSNCSEELEYNGIDIKVKCPKCFAILNKDGVMQYPPQIKDFRLLCPACKVNNWLIVSKKDDKAKVRCQSCAKEYNLTFATKKPNELINKTQFLYTGKVRCLQCHTTIYVSGTSGVTDRTVKCKKCGLEFSYDITNERYKKISQIEEVIPKGLKIDNKKESSEEGGQKMAKEKKVEKASEKKVKKEHNFLEGTEKDNKEEISKRLQKAKVEEKKVEKVEPKKEVKVKEEKKIEKINDTDIPKKEDKEVNVQATTVITKPEAKTKEVKKEKVEVKEEKKVEVKEEKVKEKPEAKVKAKETPKTEEPKAKSKIEKKEVRVEDKKAEAIKKETPKEKKPTEARFEYEVNSLTETLEDVKPAEIDESARLTTEQRNALPDSMFAVVVKVKDKRTGKTRKIRMYPINDEAHVRNALARLGQPRPKATLKRLGVSIEAVKAKILRRARQLKMTQLLERQKQATKEKSSLVRRAVGRILDTKKTLRKAKAERDEFEKQVKDLTKQVELYESSAKDIIKRREELGDYAKEMSDEDILNDDKFGKAKAEKENTILRAKKESDDNEIVGSKVKEKSDEWYKNKRKAIDEVAFKKD